jgi:two-component system chemotaxis sensor kinase CheA
MAIPLSAVARLEEFQSASIERAGTREVVQYRGNILPLVRVASFFRSEGTQAAPSDGVLQAVVYNDNGRSIGLIVGCIQDIVKEHIDIQRTTSHPCILGSAVIQNRVTDLLDLSAVIKAADQAYCLALEN